MKKFFLWILMVLVFLALILGGTGLYFYMTTDEADLNIPCLMAETTAVPPAQGDMQLPVMSGVFYKHLAWVNDFSQPYVVPVSSDKLPLQLPEGAQGLEIEISLENRPVFSGDLAAYENFAFTANGDYKYRVTAALAAPDAGERPRAYGSYTYEFTARVRAELTVTLSDEVAKQGQLVTVQVTGNLGEVQPAGRFGERNLYFFLSGGRYTALIALPHNQETGTYNVSVEVGGQQFSLPLAVQYVPYDKHTFETADKLPDAWDDESAAAVEEYRQAIWPLYDSVEKQALWQGKFTLPVTGPLLYDYGMGSLLPGQRVSTRHSGNDYTITGIASAVAANHGKVVFAGNLRLTGGTVVIEHGGGLKSYLYYLDEVTVHTGDTVERGQTVGVLDGGSEGRAVHFEMRVGSRTVDPQPLLDGTSGIFR